MAMAGAPDLHQINLHKLKKEEALHILEELGQPVPSRWTLVEIKAKLSEIKAALPKAVVISELTGITTKTRKELQEICRSNMVDYKDTNTNGQLITLLRTHFEKKSPGDSTTQMGFGKLPSATYSEVFNDEQYTNWCITTMGETTSSWQLQKYATWAIQEKERQEAHKKKKKEEKATGASGSTGEPELNVPTGWRGTSSRSSASDVGSTGSARKTTWRGSKRRDEDEMWQEVDDVQSLKKEVKMLSGAMQNIMVKLDELNKSK